MLSLLSVSAFPSSFDSKISWYPTPSSCPPWKRPRPHDNVQSNYPGARGSRTSRFCRALSSPSIQSGESRLLAVMSRSNAEGFHHWALKRRTENSINITDYCLVKNYDISTAGDTPGVFCENSLHIPYAPWLKINELALIICQELAHSHKHIDIVL